MTPERSLAHRQNAVARDYDEASSADATEQTYLLLSSRGALYAIETAAVEEVHLLPALTPLPQAPSFVVGLCNLRGSMVAVVDLAMRLGQASQPPRTGHGLVVLKNTPPYALAVDEVRDMISLSAAQIEAPPFNIEYSIIAGMARIGGEIVLILHVPHLLPGEPNDNAATTNAAMQTEHRSVFETLDEPERAVFRERARRLAMPQSDVSQASAHALSSLRDATLRDAVTTRHLPMARVVIGGEECGIRLSEVHEFCPLLQFAPVPCCPPHIVGQMNLRGDIVTLLDIAPQLGFSAPQNANQNADRFVVVASAEATSGAVGIVVDEVRDIVVLREDELRDAPSSRNSSRYYAGAVLLQGRLMAVLDLSILLGDAALVVDETI